MGWCRAVGARNPPYPQFVYKNVVRIRTVYKNVDWAIFDHIAFSLYMLHRAHITITEHNVYAAHPTDHSMHNKTTLLLSDVDTRVGVRIPHIRLKMSI